jgi:outer membrane protein OmpA-like peptidoglycan-associated protein
MRSLYDDAGILHSRVDSQRGCNCSRRGTKFRLYQTENAADQATSQAEAVAVVGLADAAAIGAVDRRVSELDDYKIESENDVFFGLDSAVLKDEGKPALADLAKLAKSLQGYLIEISGYASKRTGQQNGSRATRTKH